MNIWRCSHVYSRIVGLLLSSLTLAILLAGCGATAPGESADQDVGNEAVVTGNDSRLGGTLVVQSSGLVQFDPIYVADDSSFQVVSNIFSLLFRYQGSELIPDLASSWEYEDDKTILYHLRKGVMWHENNTVFPTSQSREVVASDVVYSIQRAVETEGNATPADFVASYESVEAVDDHTVRLILKSPSALLFTPGRGLSTMAIVPHEAVEQLGEAFALNPIGSGPFKFVEYLPDESLTLERNDGYWKQPYLDRVLYKIIPDQDAAVIALEMGEVDILSRVPHTHFERLSSGAGFILYAGNCPIMTQIMFNMNNPLYGQQRFRQAVAYALDGDAINANVYGGMHISGCGTAGPGVPGYDPNLCANTGYDPEAARAILEDLGWEDSDGDGILEKDGEPLRLPLEIWNMSPMPQFGAAIATQLQEVGIGIELQTVEFGTWIADWSAGVDKVMIMSGWCGDGGMNGLWGGKGMARSMGYDDPKIFALLDKANTLVDPVERDEILREAAEEIYGQIWAVPMGFYRYSQASHDWVNDYQGAFLYQNLCTERNNVWLGIERRKTEK